MRHICERGKSGALGKVVFFAVREALYAPAHPDSKRQAKRKQRKLTRRQRLLPSGWLPEPIILPVRIQEESVKIEPLREVAASLMRPETPVQNLPRRMREPKAPRDKLKEVAERTARLAKILKVPYEVWQQQIQDDERKIKEQKELEKIRLKEIAAQERKANRRGRPKRYYQEFYGPSWFPIQAEAMARSKGICELCHINKALHVHHILPIRYFADSEDAHYINNTLAVCIPCHTVEHRQMKYRFPLFDHLKLDLCRPGRLKLCAPSLFYESHP